MRRRTKGRNYALQIMYAQEITESEPTELKKDFLLEYPDEDLTVRAFAENLFDKAYENRETDESTIRQFLTDKWPYERLAVVEKCILRLAVTEFFHGDAPAYAVLDDYVTIAKEYGDDKAASFINGILENIRVKFSIERGDERKQD